MLSAVSHESQDAVTRLGLDEASARRVHLQTAVSLLVRVEPELSWQPGRRGAPGAMALTGTVHLPELHAEIAFRGDNRTGPEGEPPIEHRATAQILPRHFTRRIPLQRLAPPSPERRDVLALTPMQGRDTQWAEHYVGQFEGDSLKFDQFVPVDATFDVVLTPQVSEDGSTTRVDVSGMLNFERAMSLRLAFRNLDQFTAPPSAFDREEAVLLAAGTQLPIPRQTVSHPAGRNPVATVRVIGADGRVVSAEQVLAPPAWEASS